MKWRWFKAVLLVLCAMMGIAAGWIHWRSHRISSVGHWYGEKSWAGIYCARGKIELGIGREAVDAAIKHDFYERPVKAKATEFDFEGSFQGRRWLGFGYFRSDSPRAHYLLAPLWALWTTASLPVLFVLVKAAKRTWRSRSNLCVNCGYDLRGSSEKCPECGHPLHTHKGALLYNI
jgi:hypothetical protein